MEHDAGETDDLSGLDHQLALERLIPLTGDADQVAARAQRDVGFGRVADERAVYEQLAPGSGVDQEPTSFL